MIVQHLSNRCQFFARILITSRAHSLTHTQHTHLIQIRRNHSWWLFFFPVHFRQSLSQQSDATISVNNNYLFCGNFKCARISVSVIGIVHVLASSVWKKYSNERVSSIFVLIFRQKTKILCKRTNCRSTSFSFFGFLFLEIVRVCATEQRSFGKI